MDYLNDPKTRALLGVSPTLANITFASCNHVVGGAFRGAMDKFRVQVSSALTHSYTLHLIEITNTQNQFYLEALLDRGISALIYAGSYDWICNWIGNKRMVEGLEWSGAEEFRKEELKTWSVAGESNGPAGRFKSAGGLTFLTIEGAGHMVSISAQSLS